MGLGLQELNQDFRDYGVSPSFFRMMVIKSLLPQATPSSFLSASFSFECNSFAFLQQMALFQKVFPVVGDGHFIFSTMSAHPFARATMGISLVEKNGFLRKSPINLVLIIKFN